MTPGQTGTATMPVDGESQLSASVSWPKSTQTASDSDNTLYAGDATYAASNPGSNVATKTVPATGTGTISATVTESAGDHTDQRYSSQYGQVPALSHLDMVFHPNANGWFVSWVYADDQFNPTTVSQQLLDESGNVLQTAPANTGINYSFNDLPTYGGSHTFTLRLLSASPTPTSWYMDADYTMYATLTTELLNPAGARVALASPVSGAPQQTLSYNNTATGNYTVRITSADAWASLTLADTYPVSGYADLTLQLKDAQGNLVAQSRSSSGSAGVTYTSSPTAGGSYTWAVVNNGPTYNATWSLSWTATTLSDDTSTGSVAAGGTATRSETADAAGPTSVTTSWTRGSHPVTSSTTLSVPGGSAGTKTITPDAVGAASATYSWNPSSTSYSGSGTVGTTGTSFGPEFSTGANGTVTITLTWPSATPNPDLDLAVIDKVTGSTVQSSAQLTGNQEQVQFTQTGLSYGQSQTYQVKVTAKALGSSYTLSGVYPVWDRLARFELLNSSNTVIASGTPPTSGTASVSLSASSLPAGTYTIRALSGGYGSSGTLTETHQVQAFADVTVALKNSSGQTLASTRTASGSASLATTVPASGTYAVAVTDNSTDIAVPSYTLTVTLPKQHLPSVTLTLKNPSGSVVAASTGATPSITASAVRGGYTLVVTPFTGTGTATLSASYPPGPATETITYDGRDHATSVDDGTNKVVETLAPSGRVLERKVFDDVTNAIKEDTLLGYDGDGDSPAYARPAAGGPVTTYVSGPAGLLLTDTGGTAAWSVVDAHGDIAGTTDAGGVFSASPSTDEFGVGPQAPGRLGWLGANERFSLGTNLGLVRLGARLYDPNLGRFLEVDPIEGGCANDYAYVFGDPVNASDEEGLSACGGKLKWKTYYTFYTRPTKWKNGLEPFAGKLGKSPTKIGPGIMFRFKWKYQFQSAHSGSTLCYRVIRTLGMQFRQTLGWWKFAIYTTSGWDPIATEIVTSPYSAAGSAGHSDATTRYGVD